MSMYAKQDFTTETGEQEIIPIPRGHDVTIIVSGTATSDDIDVEITVDDPKKTAVERFKLEENILAIANSSPYIKTLEGPVSGIGIDIDGNSSNNIKVRVLSAQGI